LFAGVYIYDENKNINSDAEVRQLNNFCPEGYGCLRGCDNNPHCGPG